MSKLVIVESPTKAKTLTGILGRNYVIKASMGHIRDLPKSGLAIDVDHDFTPDYTVSDKAKKVLDDLKKSAKEKDTIVLATDPDREGEAIAWHLRELLTPKTKKEKEALSFERVVFHELTKEAVEDAFNHPGLLNMDLVNAQQARRVLDRLVGYKLSPLLWKKVRYGLSAGRVQSVAVRLIVERERERQAFKSEEYWSIKANFSDSKKERDFIANYVPAQETISSRDAENIVSELNNDTFQVTSVKKSERRKKAYPPLRTSTLQQALANVYGFTAKRTMDAAQKLFEKGFITYHRTDSLNLSPQFIDSSRAYILKTFGKDYVPEEPAIYKTKSANAQEAHEAIRPTDLNRVPNGYHEITEDEAKVYSIVWLRSVESQMTPAIYDQTTIEVTSSKQHLFRATGSVIKFDGWLAAGKKVSIEENDEEIVPMPSYEEREKILIHEVLPEQHFTQPPARYSDATLIKQLEEIGVGRPSTYAPTITTIQARGYVQRDGRYFIPTDVAYVVNDLLVNHFPKIVDYEFTANMENQLDEVSAGEREWVPVVREFYGPFEKDLIEKDKQLQKADLTTLGESDEKCPDCGKNLIIKLGKYGKFLSCSGYPDCEFAKPIFTEEEIASGEADKKDFGKCPNCTDGVFIMRTGKYGKFLACSNYPKCKTTQPYLQKIDVKCPRCKDGDVVVKKARRKIFYGCSRYPDCDWSSWTKPDENTKDIPLSERKAKSSKTAKVKENVAKTVKKTRAAKQKTAAKTPEKTDTIVTSEENNSVSSIM